MIQVKQGIFVRPYPYTAATAINVSQGDGPDLFTASNVKLGTITHPSIPAVLTNLQQGTNLDQNALIGVSFRGSGVQFDRVKVRFAGTPSTVGLMLTTQEGAVYYWNQESSKQGSIWVFDVEDATTGELSARTLNFFKAKARPTWRSQVNDVRAKLLPLWRWDVRGGPGTIFGTTTVEGQLKQRKVFLLHQKTHGLWRSQLSDEQGRFRFDHLPLDTEFTVVGEDQTCEQNSVIYARVTPWVEEPTEP